MGILRLLLALSVIASHVGPILGFNFVGGTLAVQSFFIISGFYMSIVLNEKYVFEKASFKLFMGNRLLKLFPTYCFILIISIITSVIIYASSGKQSFPVIENYIRFKPGVGAFLYLCFAQLLILGQDLVMFLGLKTDGTLYFTSNFQNTSPHLYAFMLIPQAWSLGIELLFYAVAPFILKKGIKPVILIIFCSLLVRFVIFYKIGLQNDPWTYRFFPTELVFFLLGNLSYRLYKIISLKRVPYRLSWIVFAITLFAVISHPLYRAQHAAVFQYSWAELIYLAFIILAIPFLFAHFKNKRYDSIAGDLSYPLYLSHMLIALICSRINIAYLHTGISITLLSLLFSYILNQLITTPVKKIKERRLNDMMLTPNSLLTNNEDYKHEVVKKQRLSWLYRPNKNC